MDNFYVRNLLQGFRKMSDRQAALNFLSWAHREQDVPKHKTIMISTTLGS